MGTDNKQLKAAKFFNNEIPVHIVTYSDKWINGYIQEFDGIELQVLDRKEGLVTLKINDVDKLVEFEGDYSTLKRFEE